MLSRLDRSSLMDYLVSLLKRIKVVLRNQPFNLKPIILYVFIRKFIIDFLELFLYFHLSKKLVIKAGNLHFFVFYLFLNFAYNLVCLFFCKTFEFCKISKVNFLFFGF